MENFKYKVCNKRLCEVANCLVVEIDNTIQIVKNRGRHNTFEEIENLKFIKVTKDDILKCDNVIEVYFGKNVWYMG